MSFRKIVVLLAILQSVSSLIKVTNIYCESLNQSWVVVRECRLRAIKRDLTIFNMNVDIPKPIHKIDLNFAFLKKANGYKPFLVNATINACAFMKKRNDPTFAIVMDLIKDFTNINHSCPFVGEQIIRGFYPKHELVKLPVPSGEYAMQLIAYFYSKKAFLTNVYFTFAEK